MKSIAVVAREKEFALSIKKDLEQYFAEHAEIRSYSTEEIRQVEQLEEECIVMSALTVFKMVQPKMKPSASIQVINFALCKENLKHLDQVPTDQKVLIANVDYKVCMQVAAQIYEAGFRDFDFVPYYGDEETRDPSIKVALTPNELEMVPPGMERVINIGNRPVDPGCILGIAGKLGIDDIFGAPAAKKAREQIVVAEDTGIEKILSDKQDTSQQIGALIELIEDGIILTDAQRAILLSNAKAQRILKTRGELLEGFSVSEVIPDLRFEDARDQIVEMDGKTLVVSVKAIVDEGRQRGNIVTLKNFAETEERQHDVRARVAGESHEARYTFSDIIGESPEIRECIQVAGRMAGSDSAVLITGESGTGKEVFAQSIHNSSARSRFNFVALNCAAIPEQLLESELFGYEEGAFTGARKGGKIGYFELAHKGTIFLDEIGEMPLTLQSKLLRVLEEKTVSRIGSAKLIDIDVRVIAATNQNLWELIEKKQFREDLYYRINVLPLSIPPLRKRQGDVGLLLEYYRGQQGGTWRLSEEAMNRVLAYGWRGNVRELRNTAEYLTSLGKEEIETKDLPAGFLRAEETKPGRRVFPKALSIGETGDADSAFIMNRWKDLPLYQGILEILCAAWENHERVGRNCIETRLARQGIYYTEGEIRHALRRLADGGYIKSRQGRGGSEILDSGRELLEKITGLIG